MTAKEYLGQAYLLDKRINSKLEQVEKLRSLTRKVTIAFGEAPVSHTRNTSSLQDTIIRLMEAEKELSEAIETLVDLKREIHRTLQGVTNPQYQLLLELRYLCFKDWDEISRELELEDRYVFKVHGRALADVNILLNSKKDSKRH
jgi:hypothetical protein